jgi:hypothetical protein
MKRTKPKYFIRKTPAKPSRYQATIRSIDTEIKRSKILLFSIFAGIILIAYLLLTKSASVATEYISLPSLPTLLTPTISFDPVRGVTDSIGHSVGNITDDLTLPQIPQVALPEIPMPTVPHIKTPELPRLETPEVTFSFEDVIQTIMSFTLSFLEGIAATITAIVHALDPRPVINAAWTGITGFFARVAADAYIAAQPLMPIIYMAGNAFWETLQMLEEGTVVISTVLQYIVENSQ